MLWERYSIRRVMLWLYRLNQRIERRLGTFGLLLIAAGILVAAMIGIVSVGAASDPQKATTRTTATSSTASLPGKDSFTTTAFQVSAPDAQPKRYCALLADNDETRARGLMGREGLGGYDAMIFSFPEDASSPFYMPNVSFPLSIAWFRADGTFVSSADMEPCKEEANKCPRYSAASAYRFAIEVPKGALAGLGIGSKSTIAIDAGGGCG